MTQVSLVTDSVRAFLDNDDSSDIRNPIHSTAVAREYGFDGAIIGGVTVWSWCTPAILEALGEGWLDRGWADFRFRRPCYPGDAMAIRVGPDEAGSDGLALRMTNQDGVDCVVGHVGLGDAPWLGELSRPATPLAPTTVDDPPLLTMDNAPVGRDWIAVGAVIDEEAATAYLAESHHHREAEAPFVGPEARIHPGWLASRCEAIMRHNHFVPSSMHTESRVQFLAPASVGGPILTGACVAETFEKRGHHGIVFDTLLSDAAGRELVVIRHSTIFRIARPEERS
jgi:hypothetical protein